MSNGSNGSSAFNYVDEIYNSVVSGQQTTITTALNPVVLTQDNSASYGAVIVSPSQDLTVFGDVVVIEGPLSLPGMTVTIYARQIGTQPDSNNNPATIDVSGADGPPPPPPLAPAGPGGNGIVRGGTSAQGGGGAAGAAGAPGADGGGAGSITLYTESFQSGTALTLNANGGTGGEGQTGQAGGAGGQGAPAWTAAGYSPHAPVCGNGGAGGNGGQGGSGGAGGAGGNGGSVSVSCVQELPTTGIALNYDAGAGGAWGAGGAGGAFGSGGGVPDGTPIRCTAGTDGAPGSPGSQGAQGAEGSPGSGTSGGGIAYDQIAPYASSSQRLMMLQVAKLSYLSSNVATNQIGFPQTGVLLTWLQNVTAYFNTTTGTIPENPLGLQTNDIAQIVGIYNQANSLAYQMLQGLDYFGNPSTYVPMISYTSCQDVLTTMQSDLETIESTYNTYFTALQTGAAALAQLQDAAASLADQQETLLDTQQALSQQLQDQAPTLATDAAAVAAQQLVLVAAVSSFETEITTLAGVNCVLDNVLAGLQVLTPLVDDESFAAATGIISMIVGAVQGNVASLAAIPSLPTQYTVSQVYYLNTAFTVADAYTTSQTLITPTDPNAYKVLATQAQLGEALQPYLNLATAQSALDAMNQYVALVQQMNNDIMTFNGMMAQYATVTGQIAQVAAQAAEAQNALADSSTNPGLPLLVTYLGRLYEDAKAMIIYQLYLTGQAFGFWSLDADFSVYSALPLGSIGTIDSATVSQAQSGLLSSWVEAIDNYGSGAQTFGGTAPFSGIQLVINDPASIQALTVSGVLWFTLPPVMPWTNSAQSVFAGMADVRVTTARPWITGATTSSLVPDELTVTLTHMGIETIVSQDGTLVGFTHEPVTVEFIYNYQTNAIIEDATINTPYGSSSANYALLGPFTLWQLQVSAEANTGLDLSGVTQIVIEFAGQNYTLDTLPASLSFGGQGTGYVTIPVSDGSLSVGSMLTVSAMVCLDASCGDAMTIVASNGFVVGTGAGDSATTNTYRSLTATFTDTDGNVYTLDDGQITLGQWTVVAVTWQQNVQLEGFVNSVSVGAVGTQDYPLDTLDTATSSSPVYLGINTDLATAPYFGSLSCVTLAAGPNTSSQYLGIWALDDGGTSTDVADQSGNRNTGSIYNNAGDPPDVTWGDSPEALLY